MKSGHPSASSPGVTQARRDVTAGRPWPARRGPSYLPSRGWLTGCCGIRHFVMSLPAERQPRMLQPVATFLHDRLSGRRVLSRHLSLTRLPGLLGASNRNQIHYYPRRFLWVTGPGDGRAEQTGTVTTTISIQTAPATT